MNKTSIKILYHKNKMEEYKKQKKRILISIWLLIVLFTIYVSYRISSARDSAIQTWNWIKWSIKESPMEQETLPNESEFQEWYNTEQKEYSIFHSDEDIKKDDEEKQRLLEQYKAEYSSDEEATTTYNDFNNNEDYDEYSYIE